MSLTEVLARKNIDKGLDDIFKSSAGLSISLQRGTAQKRKSDTIRIDEGVKRPRTSLDIVPKPDSTNRANKRLGKRKERQPNTEDDGDKDEHAEENRESSEEEKEEEDDASEGRSADEASDNIPEHESVRKAGKQKKRPKKAKYAPEGETREQRDARTIFIGNLPVAVVKSKPLEKQLRRHILSFVPSAKIESIRFRSIAFRNPTSTLPDYDEKSPKQKRSQQRAADWRAEHVQTDGGSSKKEKEEVEEDKKGEKKYMTPAEKRRLAAIKGELHEHGAATANAYVVFAYPIPSGGQEEAHVPRQKVMDPIEAALVAVRKAHGSTFNDHILRVDLAGKPTTGGLDLGATTTDPRLSIFVGNLDFASSENDVRAFFEAIMREERGQPNANGDVTDSDEAQSSSSRKNATWVTRVRIVRDKETQLGKGFAYVQFVDRDCVDEILMLEAEKLKFAKRTLRVQRCKTLPSLSAAKSKQAHSSAQTIISNATSKIRRDPGSATPLKGDPSLGTRLVGLPKEERKKAKANDPARVARRLAKKKARTGVDNGEKAKKHARERKDRKKGSGNASGMEKKKRVRSERNYQRKNVKK